MEETGEGRAGQERKGGPSETGLKSQGRRGRRGQRSRVTEGAGEDGRVEGDRLGWRVTGNQRRWMH